MITKIVLGNNPDDLKYFRDSFKLKLYKDKLKRKKLKRKLENQEMFVEQSGNNNKTQKS